MLGMRVCICVHDFDDLTVFGVQGSSWGETGIWKSYVVGFTVPGWQLVAYLVDGQVSEEHCIHGFSLVQMACRTIGAE